MRAMPRHFHDECGQCRRVVPLLLLRQSERRHAYHHDCQLCRTHCLSQLCCPDHDHCTLLSLDPTDTTVL